MTPGYDSFFIYATALRDLKDFDTFVSWNLYHGLGGIQYPFNASLIPEYLISHLFFTGGPALAAYWTLATAMIFLSTYGLGRVFGLGVTVASLAAWAAAGVQMPLIWHYNNYLYTDVPFVIPGTYTLFAIIAALARMAEQRSARSAVLSASVVFLALVYATLAFPQYIGPMLAAVIGPAVFALVWARGVRRKTIVLVLGSLAALSAAALFKDYLYGMLVYGPRLLQIRSPTEFHWEGLVWNLVATVRLLVWNFVSTVRLIGWNWSGSGQTAYLVFLHLGVLLCALITIFDIRNDRRRFGLAAGFVVFSWLSLPMYAASISIGTMLGVVPISGFAITYTDSMQAPIYLLGWATVFQWIYFWIKKNWISDPIWRERLARHTRLIPLYVIVFILFKVLNQTHANTVGYLLAAEQPAIGSYLIKELGIRDTDKSFRGRFANVSRVRETGNLFYLEAMVDFALVSKHRTDLRFGLSVRDVPTLVEWNNFISPSLFVFAFHLLNTGPEQPNRNKLTVAKADVRLMRILGVSYIINNDPLDEPGLTLVMTEVLGRPEYQFYLYRVDAPNLGGLSPTRAHYLPTVKQQLDFLGDPTVDLARQFSFADIDLSFQNLSPARYASMRFDDQKVYVRAEAEGDSVVVLPLQFSRCLRIEFTEGSTRPILFAADLFLTGIHFKDRLEASLSFDFHPFRNPRCRMRDIEDAVVQRVMDVREYRGRTIWPRR